jgi:arylsulfatase A-like enzyme
MIMKRLIFFVIIFLLLANFSFAQQKPNIILIVADDLGYGDVGCYGQQKIKTPSIDLLAKEGMQFSDFYAGTAVCAPSRASLMTGMHTGHTDVRGNKSFKPEGQYPLADSTITIAQILKNNGYATGDFGKWGLGFVGSNSVPLKKGFETFYGYNCQTLAHNYYPDHLWDNETKVLLDANKAGETIYSADLIHQKALEFIKQKKNQPFFLFLSYTLPHAALSVPHDAVYNQYVKMFNESALDEKKWKKFEGASFEPYPHAAYAAMVSRLDKYVGDVMNAIKKSGIEKNTLIIFTSDNGPHREGGNDPEFFNSSGIYKGIKRDLYEGGMREPFIAKWEGTIKPGTKNNYVGAFWDLFPTFEEIAGIKSNKKIDGISILPTLTGNDKQQKQHEYLYWEFHENNGRQAVRYGKWKGVKYNVSINTNAPIELYDLEKDPSEKNNIASSHKDIIEKLELFIQQAHQSNKDWPLLKQELGDRKIE